MKIQPWSSDPKPGVLEPDVIGMMLDVVRPWVIEQGYQPEELTRHVELLAGGDVMLRRYVKDKRGRVQLDPDSPEDHRQVLTEDVRVRPLSPFPFDSTEAAIALYHRNRVAAAAVPG